MAIQLQSEKAHQIAQAFIERYVCYFGPPKNLFSDNHPSFISTITKHVCNILGIKKYEIPFYTPRGNPAERLIGSISHLLRASIKEPDTRNWHIILPLICYSLNATASAELGGFSPNEIQFARPLPKNFITLIPPDEKFNDVDYSEYLYGLARAREYQHEIITKTARQK